MIDIITRRIQESINVKSDLLNNSKLLKNIEILSNNIVDSVSKGNKIVICGNGGSASDALHFASEIVGRFQKERNAWPVIVLNSDVSTITAISNDYGYDDVFARQAEGHIKNGDVFIGISTSGNSENVYRAIKIAKSKGALTAGLLGKDGGKTLTEVDIPILVPCNVTARVQESHILIIHIICELVEEKLIKC